MLHFEILINQTMIGEVHIQRLHAVPPDGLCMYQVTTIHNGILRQSHVEHNYHDGALVLIRKALTAVETAERKT